jgi:hypothetical protein
MAGNLDINPKEQPNMADLDKQKAEQEVSWLGGRLREPSTYAGLAVLLSLAHFADASTWANAIESIGIGVGGIIAILLPERKAAAVIAAFAIGAMLSLSPAHAQTTAPTPATPAPAPAASPAPVFVTKAPTATAAAPSFAFPYNTNNGWYAGLGTLGGGGSVSVSGANLNQNSLTTNQIGIYGSVGHIWNVPNTPMFVAIEQDIGYVNINGSAPGLSYEGPLDLETRFLIGAPINQIASFFPSWFQMPSFGSLPAGFTAQAMKFYMGAAVHLSDDTLAFQGAKNSVWGASPTIIPAGVLMQLTNGSVADFSTEVRLNDRGLCTTGPVESACGRANVEILGGVRYLFGVPL